MLKVVSVNVGLPRQVVWRGKPVTTAIFKEPVADSVLLQKLNFEGDRQADLTVHGGPDKAVYVYPSEYYDFWRRELDRPDLNWGAFGENLTTCGLLDEAVNIGDRFRIGTAEVQVTQPRVPCFKLNLKFDREDMVKRFGQSRFSGFYVAVLKEGRVAAGDPIIRLKQDEHGLKVTEVTRLYLSDRHDLAAMRRAKQVPALAGVWKEFFQRQLGESPASED